MITLDPWTTHENSKEILLAVLETQPDASFVSCHVELGPRAGAKTSQLNHSL
jgi:hypothetical protein